MVIFARLNSNVCLFWANFLYMCIGKEIKSATKIKEHEWCRWERCGRAGWDAWYAFVHSFSPSRGELITILQPWIGISNHDLNSEIVFAIDNLGKKFSHEEFDWQEAYTRVKDFAFYDCVRCLICFTFIFFMFPDWIRNGLRSLCLIENSCDLC